MYPDGIWAAFWTSFGRSFISVLSSFIPGPVLLGSTYIAHRVRSACSLLVGSHRTSFTLLTHSLPNDSVNFTPFRYVNSNFLTTSKVSKCFNEILIYFTTNNEINAIQTYSVRGYSYWLAVIIAGAYDDDDAVLTLALTSLKSCLWSLKNRL